MKHLTFKYLVSAFALLFSSYSFSAVITGIDLYDNSAANGPPVGTHFSSCPELQAMFLGSDGYIPTGKCTFSGGPQDSNPTVRIWFLQGGGYIGFISVRVDYGDDCAIINGDHMQCGHVCNTYDSCGYYAALECTNRGDIYAGITWNDAANWGFQCLEQPDIPGYEDNIPEGSIVENNISFKGDIGEQGVRGFDGLDGYEGERGKRGKQGVIGATGATGRTGFSGQDGEDGIDGVGCEVYREGEYSVLRCGAGQSLTSVDVMDSRYIDVLALQKSQLDEMKNSGCTVAGVNEATGTISFSCLGNTVLPPVSLLGKQGEQGIQGEQGKEGIQGKDGIDGIIGKDGLAGKDGLDGENGIDGTNGLEGKQGIAGVAGLDGLDGDNVDTAAVVNAINSASDRLNNNLDDKFQFADQSLELNGLEGLDGVFDAGELNKLKAEIEAQTVLISEAFNEKKASLTSQFMLDSTSVGFTNSSFTISVAGHSFAMPSMGDVWAPYLGSLSNVIYLLALIASFVIVMGGAKS